MREVCEFCVCGLDKCAREGERERIKRAQDTDREREMQGDVAYAALMTESFLRSHQQAVPRGIEYDSEHGNLQQQQPVVFNCSSTAAVVVYATCHCNRPCGWWLKLMSVDATLQQLHFFATHLPRKQRTSTHDTAVAFDSERESSATLPVTR